MAIDPKRLYSRVRLAIVLVVFLGIAYFVYRFRIETIPAGYTCLEPEFPSGARVVVDLRYASSRAIEPGQAIAFRWKDGTRDGKRFGRIAALAGSALEYGEEGLTIDRGPSDLPPPPGIPLPAVVSTGHVLVVTNFAVTTDETLDTRVTYLVEESAILSRLLVPLLGW